MSLQEIQTVTGGDLSGGDVAFHSVSIDTRTLAADELFVAIKGPNFNGNEFVAKAAEMNACAALVDEPVESELPILAVTDARAALGKMGALNRSRSGACVIALTGSQGKTTVKEMTAAILAGCGGVMMTRGNLNNDLGVPLSLLKIESQHQFAVIEMGANGPGEIAYTVELAQPQIGHITNIAGTHLEGFGDLDGVARAKAEIWQGIRQGGTAVINLDEVYAPQFIEQVQARSLDRTVTTISGKGSKEADYFASEIQLQDFHSAAFTLNTPQSAIGITLNVAGRHNVNNALAAAALAMAAGASPVQVKAGLESFVPVKGRMCIVKGVNGATVIDDTYNASPSSFRAAIDVLAVTGGTTIVVMGDMGELGNEAESAHADVGDYARRNGVSHFLGVGKLSALAVKSFGENGRFLEDREQFADTIRPLLNDSVTVLIKGSRSQGMEKLVTQIQAGAE